MFDKLYKDFHPIEFDDLAPINDPKFREPLELNMSGAQYCFWDGQEESFCKLLITNENYQYVISCLIDNFHCSHFPDLAGLILSKKYIIIFNMGQLGLRGKLYLNNKTVLNKNTFLSGSLSTSLENHGLGYQLEHIDIHCFKADLNKSFCSIF